MDILKVFAIVIIGVQAVSRTGRRSCQAQRRWRKHGRRAYNRISGMETLRLVQAGRLG
jgi:hypothetical protein